MAFLFNFLRNLDNKRNFIVVDLKNVTYKISGLGLKKNGLLNELVFACDFADGNVGGAIMQLMERGLDMKPYQSKVIDAKVNKYGDDIVITY